MKKKTSKGFTLAEFVVTIALMGTLLGIALPSYSTITNSAQDAINVANMERIKNTFSQYMFDTHIQGYPHLPTMPAWWVSADSLGYAYQTYIEKKYS